MTLAHTVANVSLMAGKWRLELEEYFFQASNSTRKFAVQNENLALAESSYAGRSIPWSGTRELSRT
jgi:hypothetical protein